MVRLIDLGIEKIKTLLIQMSTIAEDAISLALNSYLLGIGSRDEVFSKVSQLKQLYEEVSDLVVEVIARYQPVAQDLRFLKSSLEVSYGFYRFGRYAYDIVIALTLTPSIGMCSKDVVKDVGENVKQMIRFSIESFLERNLEKAKKVKELDSIIDYAYINTLSEALKNPNTCNFINALIIRYLERIADHAVYIANATIYVTLGTSIE